MPEIESIYPNLKQNLTETSSGSPVCSYTSDLGDNGPILTLIHGYPQSAFIWRHIIPELADKISLFVPEIPGYGVSTLCRSSHSKKVVGSALLEAMSSVFKISKSSPRKVVLGGHDRRARICHRLAVDKEEYPALRVLGTVLLDIIPTKVQWEAFAHPAVCVGYIHWPFLANTDVSIPMIEAYGGGKLAERGFERINSTNEAGMKRFESNNAWDLHAQFSDKEETIRGTCEDYASGAAPEAAEQAEDQMNDKKISVPSLVMLSKAKPGSTADVAAIWKTGSIPVSTMSG